MRGGRRGVVARTGESSVAATVSKGDGRTPEMCNLRGATALPSGDGGIDDGVEHAARARFAPLLAGGVDITSVALRLHPMLSEVKSFNGEMLSFVLEVCVKVEVHDTEVQIIYMIYEWMSCWTGGTRYMSVNSNYRKLRADSMDRAEMA